MSKFLVIKICNFDFQYFNVGQLKIIVDHPGYQLGGPLGDPGFFVSCSTDIAYVYFPGALVATVSPSLR